MLTSNTEIGAAQLIPLILLTACAACLQTALFTWRKNFCGRREREKGRRKGGRIAEKRDRGSERRREVRKEEGEKGRGGEKKRETNKMVVYTSKLQQFTA